LRAGAVRRRASNEIGCLVTYKSRPASTRPDARATTTATAIGTAVCHSSDLASTRRWTPFAARTASARRRSRICSSATTSRLAAASSSVITEPIMSIRPISVKVLSIPLVAANAYALHPNGTRALRTYSTKL